MAHRFFLPNIPPGDVATLTGDQAHHAAQVMRFRVGDQIVLFDGAGLQADCEITELNKKHVELQILRREVSDRSLTTSITIAVALPKSDRQKFLVEKLVELGVDHLIPLQAQRNVAAATDKVITRIEKQIIEASKQCERNRLMTVSKPMDFANIKRWSAEHVGTRLWVADPYEGQFAAHVLSELESQTASHQIIAVGPEGGFADGELAAAVELGFNKLRIGPTILRVETAAIAAAAIFGAGSWHS
jgi:16S rRNA (uracil1498-N3)-methyltransferase